MADSGWLYATLENDWVTSSGLTMKYRKIDDWVYIRGQIKDGSYFGGLALFTLPSGYRPAFEGLQVSNFSGTGEIYIDTDGKVHAYSVPLSGVVSIYASFPVG